MLYRSVPKNKWVLPQPPVRCVADTAGTEANHRPDAGQQESATRFRRAVLSMYRRGERGQSGACAGSRLLAGRVHCTALAAGVWRPRASGFEHGFARRSELLPRRLTAYLRQVGITQRQRQRQALCRLLCLMLTALSLDAVTCHCSIPTSPSLPIARCDLRNDPSGDLR